MLPAKPLSEMTTEEALAVIRASRIKRVTATVKPTARAKGPARKATNNTKAANILDQINASLSNNGGSNATP